VSNSNNYFPNSSVRILLLASYLYLASFLSMDWSILLFYLQSTVLFFGSHAMALSLCMYLCICIYVLHPSIFILGHRLSALSLYCRLHKIVVHCHRLIVALANAGNFGNDAF
jgi:hypothetical protein